ncbi:MAG: hypothetical protein KAH32_03745, partial [Chlamydiia bacterium]|nr:hypothetical protein [Chlamydiia bacterium]
LGDLVRPLYDKDYKAMYSREHNLKEFVAGGCLSIGLGILSINMQMNSRGFLSTICLFSGYLVASVTNCFGSTPAVYINKNVPAPGHFIKI